MALFPLLDQESGSRDSIGPSLKSGDLGMIPITKLQDMWSKERVTSLLPLLSALVIVFAMIPLSVPYSLLLLLLSLPLF